LVVALFARGAAAQPAAGGPDPQVVKEATTLFTKGTELYGTKSYADALAAFQRSHELVSSPNSRLYIARCLRDMGRTVEAAAEFEKVEREAGAKIAAGDSHYAETAKTAATEGAEVRAGLGTLSIHVTGMTAGGQVVVDGSPVTLAGDTYKAFHTPGQATVILRAPPAPEVVRAVTIRAGDRLDVELGASTPPPVPVHVRPRWMVPALVAAGGVGALGFAMSIGFGASSRSTFNSLQSSCGSNCTSPDQQDQISTGQRNQAISNASLAVGLIGAAGAAVVGVMIWRDGRAAKPSAWVQLGPGQAAVAGRF
jgi:hypothetical protein